MAEKLMTVKEVAERLNIAPHTVRRLFHKGALPGLRLKEMNAIRFKPSAVNALLERDAAK